MNKPGTVCACRGAGAPPCSALNLASAAWQKKQRWLAKQDHPLEFAAIIHGDGADEIADQLHYIATRMRETGWSAGDGGGKGMSAVWEMFRKSNDQAHRTR